MVCVLLNADQLSQQSLLNSGQLLQQSFRVWHFFEKFTVLYSHFTGQAGTGWTETGSIVRIESVPGQGQASSVGIEPVPGTGTGLQRGYMSCPWDRGQVSLGLSLSQWDRVGTGSMSVPCACTKPVPLGQAMCLY